MVEINQLGLTVFPDKLLTHCRPDRLLIKYPQFPDLLKPLNVQPHNIILRFDTVDYAREPQTTETASDSLVVRH